MKPKKISQESLIIILLTTIIILSVFLGILCLITDTHMVYADTNKTITEASMPQSEISVSTMLDEKALLELNTNSIEYSASVAVQKDPIEDILAGMVSISKDKITLDRANEIYNACEDASIKYDVSLNVLLGMMAQESNFINYRDSNKGSKYGRGMLQISDITRTDFYYKTGKKYTANDCYNLEKSLEMACWAYNYNHTGYGVEDDDKALIIAYNVGHYYYKSNKNYLLNGKYASGKPYNHYERVIEKMDLMGIGL